MIKKIKRIIGVAMPVLLISACNTDEVIIDDPSGPSTGGDNDGPTAVMRPITSQSKAEADCVYEWTPAPGQFINEEGTGMEWNESTTPQQAAEWAKNRLDNTQFVSLGAFGGYLVVGFDHSVVNTGKYDIGVYGNAFSSGAGHSNEPGIVYVMQDENGNGLPDDTWYELRGSDTFAEGTKFDYAVTYYRPNGDGQPVKWTDNLGNEGAVDYVGMFHSQASYYPSWIKADSYTLRGTCLESRTEQTSSGNWTNSPFEWGYADNRGEDNIELPGIPNCNRFRISDAINADGSAANLKFIDFVKIQTGVFSTSGWLGEVSTEVLGIVDLSILEK